MNAHCRTGEWLLPFLCRWYDADSTDPRGMGWRFDDEFSSDATPAHAPAAADLASAGGGCGSAGGGSPARAPDTSSEHAASLGGESCCSADAAAPVVSPAGKAAVSDTLHA